MKASLVSATSLMALLAFEVGIDAMIDVPCANAASFTASPGTLNFGYVLLNTTYGTTALTETVINTTRSKNTITFGGVSSSPFSGSQSIVTLSNTTGSSVTANNVYKFTPTLTGAYSTSVTIRGSRGPTTSIVPLVGTAVAPVQSSTLVTATISTGTEVVTATAYTTAGTSTLAKTITIGSQIGTTVRLGTTATIAALTVSNIGNGDLYSSTLSAAQLNGNIGALSSSVFTGASGTFSLNDSNYSGSGTATTSAAYTYQYAPTASGTNASTITATFANGSSAANNLAQTVSFTLAGTGVGPVYGSNVNGATYTDAAATGAGTVTAGTIATGTSKTGATSTITITISNAASGSLSTDPLADLTIDSVALSGANASNFSVVNFTTDSQIVAGGSVVVTLDFSGSTVGAYNADLTFTTDQGASSGLGGIGSSFTYYLSANIPEPATIVTFGMGLAGLGFVRLRRRQRMVAASA